MILNFYSIWSLFISSKVWKDIFNFFFSAILSWKKSRRSLKFKSLILKNSFWMLINSSTISWVLLIYFWNILTFSGTYWLQLRLEAVELLRLPSEIPLCLVPLKGVSIDKFCLLSPESGPSLFLLTRSVWLPRSGSKKLPVSVWAPIWSSLALKSIGSLRLKVWMRSRLSRSCLTYSGFGK